LLLFAVAAVVAACALPLALSPPSGPGSQITRARYERLREGMTEAEVDAVFGVPAGHYGSPGGCVTLEEVSFPGAVRHREWWGDAGNVEVGFGADGRLVGKHFRTVFFPQPAAPPDLVKRLRGWLGL
jgi:hypothetical protein